MSSNLLFFSEKCQMCYKLFVILKNNDLINKFKLINVDDIIKSGKQLPDQITIVPTMVIAKNKQVIEGVKIFEWVNTVRYLNNKSSLNNSQNENNNDLKGFFKSEMDGFSDSYAYCNEDRHLPHKFLNYGEEHKHEIYTAPEQSKLSKETQSHRCQKLEHERKKLENELNK